MLFPLNGMERRAEATTGRGNWGGRVSRAAAIRVSRLDEPGDPASKPRRAVSKHQGGDEMNEAEMADRLAAQTGPDWPGLA